VTKTYFACHWNHSSEEQPVEFYGELDEGRWELRKIEVYRDGRAVTLGPKDIEPGARTLAEAPIPPLEQIEADPQFEPREITREEFEAVWRQFAG
jgi:hypothetical protein